MNELPVRIYWLVMCGGVVLAAFPYDLKPEAAKYAAQISEGRPGATLEPGAIQGWIIGPGRLGT